MNRTQRRLTLLLPAATVAFALAGFARAETPDAAGKGTVGVCVRWGTDDSHLAEVVVVEPSGDATLDAAVPGTLRDMEWKKPEGYGGEWIALSVGVAGAQPGKVPNCDTLAEEAAGPARPLATGKKIAV